MGASIISALAALTGTVGGGFTSVLANWHNQRKQIRAQRVSREKRSSISSSWMPWRPALAARR
jgi:hypothetical protein